MASTISLQFWFIRTNCRHSCCASTPHCVLPWNRGNSPSAGSSEQVHHNTYPELGTSWVPLLHPSTPHLIFLLRQWVQDPLRCSDLQEEKLHKPFEDGFWRHWNRDSTGGGQKAAVPYPSLISPAGPIPSDCVHKTLGKQPAQHSWGKEHLEWCQPWEGASPGCAGVAGVQTILLHRSTKKPTKRLIIENMLLGVLAKLSGWSQPHFQAFIQDPDLSPKIISQLFSGTHAVQAEHSAQRHAPPACTAQTPSQGRYLGCTDGHLHSLWYRLVAIYSDFPSLTYFLGTNCFLVSGKLFYYLWRKVTLNYL